MDECPQRDWNEGWGKLEITIREDIWQLTERIKLRYLLPHVPSGVRSLEVGCGSAKLSALLAQNGVRVVGLDRAPQALRVARDNFDFLGVRGDLVRADVFQLPFSDAQFDLVFSTGLLEHFRHPVEVIREMLRVLRPGGLFFSDVVPLKFSLIRSAWYLRGEHRKADDEYPYTGRQIRGWLDECKLADISVFPSCVVPPLGLTHRIPWVRDLCLRADKLWTIFDDTWLGDRLGFFYLAFGTKPK